MKTVKRKLRRFRYFYGSWRNGGESRPVAFILAWADV
jgi:hypothetical protein